MKVSVLQENLNQGLTTASRFIAARAQLPVLSNVLLTASKSQLKVSATNLETGINLSLGAKIEKEGSLSVPAKILGEFVASLPAGKVELSVKENQLFLQSGSYQAEFIGLPAGEFPKVPTLLGKANFSLAKDLLAAAVSQVAFAAAADEGRPVLTGVLLVIKNNRLNLVATDGYRLSLKEASLGEIRYLGKQEAIEKAFKSGLIIPARTLLEVARVSKESETGEVKVAITPESNQAIFAFEEAEIISRLIEGEFPDFERIIPEKSTSKVVVDAQDLVRGVRMAAIFARESANIVKFAIQAGKLEISANTAQVGSNVSRIEAKTEGKDGKIAFNSRYLLDFLNAVTTEEISLEMSGSLNPGVFRPSKDASFFHIIMPVRVQE